MSDVPAAAPDGPTRAVDAFDASAAETLRPRLEVCLHAREWVDALLAGRPYGSVPAVEAAAGAAAQGLSDDGVRQALTAHPRIGERPTDAGPSSAHSRREQAGVSLDPTTAELLLRANLAYEARFGQVFLVRATGRSAEDLLALAQQRLGNDPATEGRVVRQQLGEIAVLRLRGLLDQLAQPEAGR
ncbi:2-oxo-4-hydroxy-4-carboxy-5-ureidoimidazoline decarboxylase [Aquipuribacter sp. MA13-6]|uniref:2-oxo-4-hydroxy-4-carboxy-5-ureidoimidazoline decarboxylase n=1 Tax=unclassified Aquipuribacter TaxID=2635084 RepID=UPI003EEFD76F